ncbi:MAG: VOC family protein [Bacillota bacterium]|jgi:methylmalonyl-CoA/ethylmalonyl-CoA epimerase
MQCSLNLKEINHVGFVVEDVDKTAEYFWKKFGIGPWAFIEFGPNVEKSTYYGEPCSNLMKIAESQVGPISLELIQPVSGPLPHMDFLKTKGEGMQHLGFMIDSPQEAEKLKNLGYNVICSASGIGDMKDGFAAYFDTDKSLGCVLELGCYPTDGSGVEIYKVYPDPEEKFKGKFNITKIDQIGFVVGDVDKTVEYFWNELGIGPWSFFELGTGLDKHECYGKPCEFLCKIATAQLGPLMLELIQPVSGATPHMKFLKSRGDGLQYLGIVIYDLEQIEEMKKLGYKEIASAFGIGGKDGYGVYFDTEKDLGTIIELIHFDGPPNFYKIYPDPH